MGDRPRRGGRAGFADVLAGRLRRRAAQPRDGEVKDEVTTDEVDGEDVVVVEQDNGSSLTVADADPSYPLELTNDEGDSSGTLTFSGFGEEEDITAPTDALDLAELMGGA